VSSLVRPSHVNDDFDRLANYPPTYRPFRLLTSATAWRQLHKLYIFWTASTRPTRISGQKLYRLNRLAARRRFLPKNAFDLEFDVEGQGQGQIWRRHAIRRGRFTLYAIGTEAVRARKTCLNRPRIRGCGTCTFFARYACPIFNMGDAFKLDYLRDRCKQINERYTLFPALTRPTKKVPLAILVVRTVWPPDGQTCENAPFWKKSISRFRKTFIWQKYRRCTLRSSTNLLVVFGYDIPTGFDSNCRPNWVPSNFDLQ